jgi:hypothetical protein
MVSNGVGICAGPHIQFLDHLIPLCTLLTIPLVVTDPQVFASALKRYNAVFFDDNLEGEKVQEAKALFSVEPGKCHSSFFQWGEKILKNKALSFLSWHGNSNKYRSEYWAENALCEDVLLYYGPFMADYYKEKGVWERIPHKIHVGHYKRFFQSKKTLFPTNRKKILYAPTWSFPGKIEASPFLDSIEQLIKITPNEYLLLVKPHPYFFRLFLNEMTSLKNRYEGSCAIEFLEEDFPLDSCFHEVEAFVGDYSSIGYDFLAEKKPLYFLPGKVRDPYLFSCGKEVTVNSLFNELEKPFPNEYLERGQELYHYCFGEKQPNPESIKKEIERVCQCVQ